MCHGKQHLLHICRSLGTDYGGAGLEREKQVVLVVEDQKINRDILRRILEPDYDVIEAVNGSDALALLYKRNDISAILLDIVMPVMDGYDFLRALKGTPFGSLPVIAVTAAKDAVAEQKALDLGAWDFISKPYEPKVLTARLKNVIVRSQFYLINEMKYVYEHDSLTDLYNRTGFFTRTREMLRSHGSQTFAFVRFDIDNFHMLNFFWGEEEGNRFLQFIADEIRKTIKLISPATYGRISADTFCMCIPFDRDFIESCLESAKGKLAEYNTNYLIKSSTGVYVIEDPSESVERMYEWATLAARECKGKYKTSISYYKPELSQKAMREQAIVHEMQHALDTEQFEVYLQPEYNLETEQPYGAEALIRWKHPEMGLIYPGSFIPIFECNGFIDKIDQYMWEKTCKLLRKWIDEGKKPAPISVNVSRVNVYNPNLVGLLTGLIKKYDISPSMLNLELTESVYMDDPELMKKTVISLQKAGFIVMMDDFGSGYSSLNTLKDLPVDVLKIDMNFLSSGPSGGRSKCILASVIRMAEWLSIPVIVEGVETLEQVHFLKSVGCGYAQGYYFARPMPVPEYEKLINRVRQRPFESVSENHDILFKTVWACGPQLDMFFNCFKQPAAIFEFDGGDFWTIRVNEPFHTLFGNDEPSRDKMTMTHHNLTSQEVKKVISAFSKSATLKKETSVCFSMTDKAGSDRKMRVNIQYLGKNEKSVVMFASFSFSDHT